MVITENEEFWAGLLEVESVKDGLEMFEAEKPQDYFRMINKVYNTLEQTFGKVTNANYITNWKINHFQFEDFKPCTKVFIGPAGNNNFIIL